MSTPEPITEPFTGSLCPEAEYRSNLPDSEFWARVAANLGALQEEIVDELADCIQSFYSSPCHVCGELGACAYDSEGRPMIHTVEDLDKEDD